MSFLNFYLFGCVRSWLLHSGSPLCPEDLSLQLAGFSPVMMLGCSTGWGTLFLQTVIEPVPLHWKVDFYHWITREVPCYVPEIIYIGLSIAQLWQYSSAKSSLFTSAKEFWKSLPRASGILITKVKRSESSFNFCTPHTNTWILCLCLV